METLVDTERVTNGSGDLAESQPLFQVSDIDRGQQKSPLKEADQVLMDCEDPAPMLQWGQATAKDQCTPIGETGKDDAGKLHPQESSREVSQNIDSHYSQMEQFSGQITNFPIQILSESDKSSEKFTDCNISLEHDECMKLDSQEDIPCTRQIQKNVFQKNEQTKKTTGIQCLQNEHKQGSNLKSPDKLISTVKLNNFNNQMTYATVLGANVTNKQVIEQPTPKVVEESIPLMGSSPDCGLMVERLRNSYLDDYVEAVETISGSNSVIFIGQDPEDSKYILIFLASPALVQKVVNQGIRIRGLWICATHLQQPAKKVTISGVMPYIRDEDIVDACRGFGKAVYPKLRRIPAGTRTRQYNKVKSFRRELLLIMNKDATLPEFIAIFAFGKVHKLILSTTGALCYKCSKPGHLAANCRVQSHSEQQIGVNQQHNISIENHQENLILRNSDNKKKLTIKSNQTDRQADVDTYANNEHCSTEHTKQTGVITSPLLVSPKNPKGEWITVGKKKTKVSKSSNPESPQHTSDNNKYANENNITNTNNKKENNIISIQKQDKALDTNTVIQKLAYLKNQGGIKKIITKEDLNEKETNYRSVEETSNEGSEETQDLMFQTAEGLKAKKRKKSSRSAANKNKKKTLEGKQEKNKESEDEANGQLEQELYADELPNSQNKQHPQDTDNKKRGQEYKKDIPMNPSTKKVDPNLCIAVTNALLNKLKSMKSARRNEITQDFIDKYPELLNMIDLAKPIMMESKPGTYIAKSINRLKEDVKRLTKMNNRTSARNL